MPVDELERLWQRLQPLIVDRTPLDEPPPRGTRFGSPLVLSRVHWVRPEMVVEVSYVEWTRRMPCSDMLSTWANAKINWSSRCAAAALTLASLDLGTTGPIDLRSRLRGAEYGEQGRTGPSGGRSAAEHRNGHSAAIRVLPPLPPRTASIASSMSLRGRARAPRAAEFGPRNRRLSGLDHRSNSRRRPSGSAYAVTATAS